MVIVLAPCMHAGGTPEKYMRCSSGWSNKKEFHHTDTSIDLQTNILMMGP